MVIISIIKFNIGFGVFADHVAYAHVRDEQVQDRDDEVGFIFS
jgi:hypothetical protein